MIAAADLQGRVHDEQGDWLLGEVLPEAKAGVLEAFLEFSGPITGSATIWASPELLDQISENLCDFDDDTARDTIGEIINVFVGQMLTTLGDEMIVFGGRKGSYLGNGASFDVAQQTWQKLPGGKKAPSKRESHTALWTGRFMVVLGGVRQSHPTYLPEYPEDISAYEPSTRKWHPIDAQGAPPASVDHSAVWTGKQLLVWGGAVSPNHSSLEVTGQGAALRLL